MFTSNPIVCLFNKLVIYFGFWTVFPRSTCCLLGSLWLMPCMLCLHMRVQGRVRKIFFPTAAYKVTALLIFPGPPGALKVFPIIDPFVWGQIVVQLIFFRLFHWILIYKIPPRIFLLIKLNYKIDNFKHTAINIFKWWCWRWEKSIHRMGNLDDLSLHSSFRTNTHSLCSFYVRNLSDFIEVWYRVLGLLSER